MKGFLTWLALCVVLSCQNPWSQEASLVLHGAHEWVLWKLLGCQGCLHFPSPKAECSSRSLLTLGCNPLRGVVNISGTQTTQSSTNLTKDVPTRKTEFLSHLIPAEVPSPSLLPLGSSSHDLSHNPGDTAVISQGLLGALLLRQYGTHKI